MLDAASRHFVDCAHAAWIHDCEPLPHEQGAVHGKAKAVRSRFQERDMELTWVKSLGLTLLTSGVVGALVTAVYSHFVLEKLKARLQAQVHDQTERLKSELTARNDAIRHELQRQYLRAQLSTTKTHEVYSQLIRVIRRAEGITAGLAGGFRTDLRTLSVDELTQVLNDAKPGGEVVAGILPLLTSDKSAAIQRIQEVLRRRELEDTRRALSDARNHLVLEGIFVTKRVRDLAHAALDRLGKAWSALETMRIDPHSPGYMQTYFAEVEAASNVITNLEEAMREDLLPEPIAVAPPSK